MLSYTERKGSSEQHERAVYERVLPLVDACEFFGQGQLSTEMRFFLRRIQTPLRWWPDMLAVKAKDIWFVDAKYGRQDTPNWDLEVSAYEADQRIQAAVGHPVVYVWADFTCSLNDDLAGHLIGPYQGVGEWRTPYYLISKSDIANRFLDSIFHSLK